MTRELRRYVPTVATIANITAGFVAIALAVEGEFYLAAVLIIVAVLCDSLDGALARMFRACSRFGAELDSLADIVSFGVAPAVLVGTFVPGRHSALVWALLAAFPVCAALRLARFNAAQGDESIARGAFRGLPSTAAGGCVAAAVLTIEGMAGNVHLVSGLLPWFVVLLAALMVSSIPYRHIGVVMVKHPMPCIMAGTLLVALAGVLRRQELIFPMFFWGYALSGPAVAIRARIRAYREARAS